MPRGLCAAVARATGRQSLLELQNEARALVDEVAALQAQDEAACRLVGELERQLGESEEQVAIARDRLEKRRVERSDP